MVDHASGVGAFCIKGQAVEHEQDFSALPCIRQPRT